MTAKRIWTLAASIAIIIAIGAVFLHNNAVAQPPMPPGMDAPPFDREKMMERFDADGDGELNEEEEQTLREAMRDLMGGGGRRGGPPFGMRSQREDIVDRFDTDGDGKLKGEERQSARRYMQDKEKRPGAPRFEQEIPKRKPVDVTEAKYYPDADLYDETVLRTLYLEFPNDDWYEELSDFYKTDVETPADLTVDGVTYHSVGIRFRGNSSYSTIGNSLKKPFNIAVDYDDSKQRLYGYKTLNLLNGHSDPSFLREVLYSKICRQYIPAPKANFVKLVINGENWGIYVNVQQFNKDFLRDWFETGKGVRWKISPGGNKSCALVWKGQELADYKKAFQLKTGKAPDDCWDDLMKLCETLSETPDDQLEVALDPIFDIDKALWFIALENVFIDSDGYISRGSDYCLYKDPRGRFYMIPYDNNETFRFAGGGGPNMWPSGGDPMLSPVAHEDNENLPVISRLLAIPRLRARYLAHIQTIVNEWLDWDILGPIIAEYQSLIDAEVKADDKKLYPYEAFANSPTEDISGMEGPRPGGFDRRGGFGRPRGRPERENRRRGGGGSPEARIIPSFKRFVSERQEFLLNHPEIKRLK